MKTLKIVFICALFVFGNASNAQQVANENFGKALNVGAGIGYYGYVGHAMPVLDVNYEMQVARNFTLAPFTGIYTYRNNFYWGNPKLPANDPSYRRYYYRETVIPIGVKGAFYFDQLFKANPSWDLYAAASAGFRIRSVIWDDGYEGDRFAYTNVRPFRTDAHIGAEYHLNSATGIYLDLSTGVSTFGFAFHF